MVLPVNWVDLGLAIVFLLVAWWSYRQGMFATLFEALRIFIAFFLSLVTYKFVTEAIVHFTGAKEFYIAFGIQMTCFLIFWWFAGNVRRFFDAAVMYSFGKWQFFYKFHKQLAIVPSVVIAFVISSLLFTVLLLLPFTSKPHQLALRSAWSKQIAPKGFSLSLGQDKSLVFQPFSGLAYQLTEKPATFLAESQKRLGNSIYLKESQYQPAYKSFQQINHARQDLGLRPIPAPPIKIIQDNTPQPIPTNQAQLPLVLPKIPSFATSAPTVQPSVPPSAQPVTPAPVATLEPTLPPAVPTTFPSPTLSPVTPPQTPTPTTPAVDIATIEQQVLEYTNQERTKHGLLAFTGDNNIAAVARAHSRDMATRGFFAHTTPDGITFDQRLRLGGISFAAAAENIAIHQSAKLVVEAWMNSPDHRDNILNPTLHKLGVGAAVGSNGIYFTQDFTD